jgi:hypothetical protein
MLLTSVSSILFQNDEFCAAATLDALRMIVSTCKGVRNELVGYAGKSKKKQTQSLLENAVLLMVQRRPAGTNGWNLMRFHDAAHRFSLTISSMTKFCMALPEDSEFYIAPDKAKTSKEYRSISFIDALNLAAKTGLRAAMERRHEVYTKVLNAARETVQKVERPLQHMRDNVKSAKLQLKKAVAELRKGVTNPKRVAGEKELHHGMRLLDQLATSIRSTLTDVWHMSYLARQFPHMKKIWHLKQDMAKINLSKKSIVWRYKTHRAHCPAMMTADCLVGLE